VRKWICRYCREPVALHYNHVAEVRCDETSTAAECSGTFEHRDRSVSCVKRTAALTHEQVYLLPVGAPL
jgi:hypothetical protein